VVAHESGHQPFGLADEYCCNGGYIPSTKVFSSQAACQADALAASAPDTCRQIADATGSVSWWRLDSAATAGNDLMIGNGDFQAADTRAHESLFSKCRTAKC
jgi:hypothetical protein